MQADDRTVQDLYGRLWLQSLRSRRSSLHHDRYLVKYFHCTIAFTGWRSLYQPVDIVSLLDMEIRRLDLLQTISSPTLTELRYVLLSLIQSETYHLLFLRKS